MLGDGDGDGVVAGSGPGAEDGAESEPERTFRRLCARWTEEPPTGTWDARYAWMRFAEEAERGRVALDWPPGAAWRVGRLPRYGVPVERRDRCLGLLERAYGWCVDLGFLELGDPRTGGDEDGDEERPPARGVWVIVTRDRLCLGYDRDRQTVYCLCRDVADLPRTGGRYLPRCYDGPLRDPAAEWSRYRLRWDERALAFLRWAEREAGAPLEHTSLFAGTLFSDPAGLPDRQTFVVGPHDERLLPSCVRRQLEALRLVPLGRLTPHYAPVWWQRITGRVYVQWTHGCLLVAAENLRVFLRSRAPWLRQKPWPARLDLESGRVRIPEGSRFWLTCTCGAASSPSPSSAP
ncbi:t28.1 [Tupaiid betaherpesvirus 1]|uniref:T28.1 n=1 Tax=Tupaiid herpesvirus 1 (strain 1) TaxID=10397 RepID=Q91TR9_TUHV1|nr:t28.1 [Tupaiid betaherpesvirus 1]AAK57068.1 t28.1 [Tupaiid betaherpesvirus 1]